MKNPFFEEFQNFENALADFESRIEEGSYDITIEGFEDKYYQLRERAQELYDLCFAYEGNKAVVDDFMRRLNEIRDGQGMYNEDEELNRMFPNRTDNFDPNGELDDGFSTDKFYGLE